MSKIKKLQTHGIFMLFYIIGINLLTTLKGNSKAVVTLELFKGSKWGKYMKVLPLIFWQIDRLRKI